MTSPDDYTPDDGAGPPPMPVPSAEDEAVDAFTRGLAAGQQLALADREFVRREASEMSYMRGREAERLFPRPGAIPEGSGRADFIEGLVLGVGLAILFRAWKHHRERDTIAGEPSYDPPEVTEP
jgi:hypothetical protein